MRICLSAILLLICAGLSAQVLTARRLTDPQTIQDLAYSPDGRYLAATSGNWVELWQGNPWQPFKTLTAHKAKVSALAFSPDSVSLASADFAGNLYLWDIDKGVLVRQLAAHKKAITCIAVSPDGLWIATTGMDGAVKLWQLATLVQKAAISLPREGVLTLKFSADSRLLVGGGGSRMLLLWNAETLSLLRVLRTQGMIQEIDLNADLLAGLGEARSVYIWDIAARQQVAPYMKLVIPLRQWVIALRFEPSGKRICTLDLKGNFVISGIGEGGHQAMVLPQELRRQRISRMALHPQRPEAALGVFGGGLWILPALPDGTPTRLQGDAGGQ